MVEEQAKIRMLSGKKADPTATLREGRHEKESIFRAMAKESYDKNVGRPNKSCQKSDTISHIDTKRELARLANTSHDTIMKLPEV